MGSSSSLKPGCTAFSRFATAFVTAVTEAVKLIWFFMLTSRRNLDSSVGIAMGYGLDDRGSIHGRGKIFLPSPGPGRL
jgi:hypothetical protein